MAVDHEQSNEDQKMESVAFSWAKMRNALALTIFADLERVETAAAMSFVAAAVGMARLVKQVGVLGCSGL